MQLNIISSYILIKVKCLYKINSLADNTNKYKIDLLADNNNNKELYRLTL